MYTQAAHRIDDPATVYEVIRSNPFSTFITSGDAVPVATHLPILLKEGEPLLLLGHMARANPQWRSFDSNPNALVIFAGPHGYVSPRLYASRPNVPTWNYVSVHAYGTVTLIEDETQALQHLGEIVATFDPQLGEEQPESTSLNYYRKMLPGIVVFQLTVERIEAKAKLNQNKSADDHNAVRARYLESDLADEQAMAKMMSLRK